MPYEFSPEERLQNILFVIEKLHNLLHECDSEYNILYKSAIEKQLLNLDKAVNEMKLQSL